MANFIRKITALTLMLVVLNLSETFGRNIYIPYASKTKELKYFWYPKDDGTGFIPAFLEGSPKETMADERDVKFYLFTSRNPTTRQELFTNNLPALDASNFDPSAKVKFYSHGFGSSSSSGHSARDAYISRYPNVNVILIDWAPLAQSPWYDRAAANTRLVGQVTARFIEFLVDNRRTTLNQIDLVGHSLGSHICGFIGSGLLVGKPPRIIGLDAALPLFGGVSNEGRLDPSDAHFVQAIHTAGGPLTSGELGFMDPIADADFYPNGGRNQPGCTGLPEVVGACSHGRAVSFFVESIRSDNFRACKCSSWTDWSTCNCATTAKMGEHTSSSARGYFYLTTNAASPYAQG